MWRKEKRVSNLVGACNCNMILDEKLSEFFGYFNVHLVFNSVVFILCLVKQWLLDKPNRKIFLNKESIHTRSFVEPSEVFCRLLRLASLVGVWTLDVKPEAPRAFELDAVELFRTI